MTQPIAKIKLAPGNVGWYDSLTNIVLTKASPEAFVYPNKNTINIKQAIKEGKVLLKEGSLSSYQKQQVLKREQNYTKKDISKNKKEEKSRDTKIISSKNIIKKQENNIEDPIKKPVINVKNKKEEADTNDKEIKQVSVNKKD